MQSNLIISSSTILHSIRYDYTTINKCYFAPTSRNATYGTITIPLLLRLLHCNCEERREEIRVKIMITTLASQNTNPFSLCILFRFKAERIRILVHVICWAVVVEYFEKYLLLVRLTASRQRTGQVTNDGQVAKTPQRDALIWSLNRASWHFGHKRTTKHQFNSNGVAIETLICLLNADLDSVVFNFSLRLSTTFDLCIPKSADD